MVESCQEECLRITNKWFKLHPHRLYTWRSPADKPEIVVWNQIDFILINGRFSSIVERAFTYPGADIHSDYYLLLAVMKIALSRTKQPDRLQRITLETLRNQSTKQRMKEEINELIQSKAFNLTST